MAILSPADIRRILRNDRNSMPVDNFRLLDSWAEYEDAQNSDERPMKYLCYEIEVIDPATGKAQHLYKAIKFLRVMRLPKSAKESLSLMDMHTQLLTAVYEQQYNFITVIANIIEPENLGLLFLYGVQGVARTIEEAKEKADLDFAGLGGILQGTYRTMHCRSLIAQESEWLREKMFSMDYLTMAMGIPKANQGGEDGGNKGVGGKNVNPDSQGTLEEIIAGMTDYEYVIQVLSSPVYLDTLQAWQTQTQRDMTMWNGQLQGTKSISANVSIPMMYMANSSTSQGWSHAYTDARGVSISNGESISHSVGQSVGHSLSQSFGQSFSQTRGTSVTNSVSNSLSTSQGTSLGQSAGISRSFGTSQNLSKVTSQNMSVTDGTSDSHSISNSISSSQGGSHTVGKTTGENTTTTISSSDARTNSDSNTEAEGSSHGNGGSSTYTDSNSFNISAGLGGINGGYGKGNTDANGTNYNDGDSYTTTIGNSNGKTHTFAINSGTTTLDTETTSDGESWSNGTSQGYSDSIGNSHSVGTSIGSSESESSGVSSSNGNTFGQSASQTASVSRGSTVGQSVGSSQSTSVGENFSVGQSDSTSASTSTSKGSTTTKGTSNSNSISNGTSGTLTTGSSGSMGLAPSIGYNKSYQWLDQSVKDILELLEFQNNRIKYALRGNGAMYTYVYVACPSLEALSAAKALAKSTWQNEFAMVQPLQILDLSDEEQKSLLYHFSAFSNDVTRIDINGVSEYKYCTVLLPKEFTAYTHPPRISEGGIFAEAMDVPHFAAPSMLKGDIYMGTILSAERYSLKNGYRTGRDFRIDESQLMHGYFSGASRSGKTVAAMRFVAELTKVRRKKTGKRLRIVCMDPKRDWRALARFVEPERFRFYSMGNPYFHPLHFNPCKIPRGVKPQTWVDVLIEIYCRAYGLLERGKQLMAETFYSLYQETGVFEECGKPGWEDRVPEMSASVTFAKAYDRMNFYKTQMDEGTSKKGRSGNDTKDAYARLLERLSAFSHPYSVERVLFGEETGLGIDEIIGKDDVTVLESKGLESTFKNFIFGVITAGFYRYALAQEGGYLAPDQYETVLVIEEANEVLTGSDTAGTGGGAQFGMTGQSEFEQILDQSAGWGLFIFAITQKIADMPKSVIANAGLVFAGKIKTEDDINVIVRSIARDPRIDDRDVVKWFPRSPTGWFVCQSSRTTSFLDCEPVLVQIAMLPISTPTDMELDEILCAKEGRTLL